MKQATFRLRSLKRSDNDSGVVWLTLGGLACWLVNVEGSLIYQGGPQMAHQIWN